MAELYTNAIDYKDVETLKRFLNPHGKIMPRRRTGLTSAAQRTLSEAVKRARFMALLPYIVR
jgi:small subunit ribosomal protein S18